MQHPSLTTLTPSGSSGPGKFYPKLIPRSVHNSTLLNNSSSFGVLGTTYGSPMVPKIPALSRTIAGHRRALSVRSKGSSESKMKRSRVIRARSVELDAEKIANFINNESSAKTNDIIAAADDPDHLSNDSKDDLPSQLNRNNSRKSKRSCKSDKSAKSIKSTKASLHLPLDVNKVSSGDSSQSTPTKNMNIARVMQSFNSVEPAENQASSIQASNYFDINKKKPVSIFAIWRYFRHLALFSLFFRCH